MTDPAVLTEVCVALFVTTSLLHAGLGLSVAQVRSPLQDPRLVLAALIGNFILIPAFALLISRLLHLSDGLSLGLLLVVLDFERVRSVVGSGALAAAGMLVVAGIGLGFVTGGTSRESETGDRAKPGSETGGQRNRGHSETGDQRNRAKPGTDHSFSGATGGAGGPVAAGPAADPGGGGPGAVPGHRCPRGSGHDSHPEAPIGDRPRFYGSLFT